MDRFRESILILFCSVVNGLGVDAEIRYVGHSWVVKKVFDVDVYQTDDKKD